MSRKTTLHSQVRFILLRSAIGFARSGSVSPDLPREAIEQRVGARERFFGGRIIALVHFESSFAQGCFNPHPERGKLRMQDGALVVQVRLDRIGGSEIG